MLLEEPKFTARMFGRDVNPLMRFAYSKILPRKRELIVKVNAVSPEDVAAARTRLASQLDDIAAAVNDSGYLVGDAFSVADLACASLLSPLFQQEHADMKRPEPLPRRLLDLFSEYDRHPAIAWADTMFQRHRPAA